VAAASSFARLLGDRAPWKPSAVCKHARLLFTSVTVHYSSYEKLFLKQGPNPAPVSPGAWVPRDHSP